ncbi:MAG: aminopeptidase [Spirochaetales bacterium]|nr:aminopeptidase [Spirochaetales bacterium]
MSLIDEYKNFLDCGKTERECVDTIIQIAENAGYREIDEFEHLNAGDKCYIVKADKSIALYHIGTLPLDKGMNILGAHIDSPRLDIKMKPLYESDGIVYLDTHYYGGIKKYQWVTMPLAMHGVICKKDGTTVIVNVGEDEDDIALCISDLLPHMAQEQMKATAADFIPGEDLDLVIGLTPRETEENKDEKERGKKAILAVLKERYDIEEDDFLSAELEVVPAGRSRTLGFDESMILGYGQDDRVCAFTSLKALLDYKGEVNRTLCCLLVDKEEIGSVGMTGMSSNLFENFTAEILDKMEDYSELKLKRAFQNSKMLSSDVNSAYDPHYAQLFDKKNSSPLSGGVVFNKYTGSRGKSGASDANAEFISQLRKVLDDKKVTFQMAEMAKVDVGGGGTIAKHCAQYGMEVIDCGVPVLSMHAPWEITSIFDIECAYKGYKAFLSI